MHSQHKFARIFRHVKMKAIVQDVRFKVFSIIDNLMAYHRDGTTLFVFYINFIKLNSYLSLVLKSYGRRFLDGYIPLAEGEKDPRNLMVAFAIARVIIIEFDISDHVEVRNVYCTISSGGIIRHSQCSIFSSATFQSPSAHRLMIDTESVLLI